MTSAYFDYQEFRFANQSYFLKFDENRWPCEGDEEDILNGAV